MLRALLGALVAVLTLLAQPAHAGEGAESPVLPEPGRPWFGPALDIRSDTPSAYAERLGATPSLYTFPLDLPLTDEGVDQLRRFAVEVAAQGAVLVLQVEPTVALDELTDDHHDAVAHLVAGLADDPGVQTLVRFAPEMNGSWRPWGQQPESYVAAFRAVADAVHAAEPTASMVWSPVYGSGYPFREETGADSEIDLSDARQVAPLDTDGSGRLDEGDDPYGPYYPGDEAVDWTGLFLYRFGQSQGIDRNVLPSRDELASRLEDRWGYPTTGRASFYDRFSASTGHPLLLETAALHNPAVGGATDLRLQQRWWREVFAALEDHPMIGAISWLELSREEPEVADEPVDWGVTRTTELAAAFRTDLAASAVALAPVTEPRQVPSAAGARRVPTEAELGPLVSGAAAGATAARIAGGLLVAVLLLVLLGGVRPAWAYADAGRDRRIDLLRGLLLVGTVALHLPVAGLLHDLAAGAVAIGGLETFVLVSGMGVGLVYPPLASRLGHTAAAGRRFRRAFVVWLAAVAAVVGTYVLGLLPGLDLDDIGRAGAVDLYAGARRLFDYPPPGWIARDLLGLQLGSWLLLPLALMAVLQLLSPLAAGPLVRGWWWAVLPASWGLYAVGRSMDVALLPSYSEVIAPLLVWQVLFVHGIALGQHRHAAADAVRRPAGAAGLAAATAGATAALWLGVAPTGSTADLPLLRLLVVATAAALALALLTVCWRPVAAATGAVLEPLGRVPLLVVLAQPVVVLVVAAVPGVAAAPAGTLVTVVALALIVLLARWRSPQLRSESPSSSSRSTTRRVLTR